MGKKEEAMKTLGEGYTAPEPSESVSESISNNMTNINSVHSASGSMITNLISVVMLMVIGILGISVIGSALVQIQPAYNVSSVSTFETNSTIVLENGESLRNVTYETGDLNVTIEQVISNIGNWSPTTGEYYG